MAEKTTPSSATTSKLAKHSSDPSKRYSAPAANKKLFVTGLLNISEKDLTEYFGQFGFIEDVIIIKDRQGKSRKFGFITFGTNESMKKCLQEKHTIN
ncbi:unnamed protein product, partial [Adineta steineri]